MPNYSALGRDWAAGSFRGGAATTGRNAELDFLAVFLKGRGLERREWSFSRGQSVPAQQLGAEVLLEEVSY